MFTGGTKYIETRDTHNMVDKEYDALVCVREDL